MEASPRGERLRVLHVTATTTGGVGLMILFLVRHLDPRAFEFGVAFGRGYLLDRSFDDCGVTTFTLSTSRGAGLGSVLKGILEVYRILRRGRYDIVQSHTSVGGLVARLAAWAARTPVVLWTVHGLGAHPGHPAWKRALLRWLEAGLDRFTDHYVAVSRDLKEEGVRARIFRADKVTVIPNGLQFDHLPAAFDAVAKRRELGLPAGAPVVGTVTRLEPQKANEVFLRAVAAASRVVPDLLAVVAGDGPERAELEALARDLGIADRVRFLGWRTDAVELLGAFDLFCMSSRWEGCPMVLLEAMAMRRPVVATDIGGVREIVEHARTGWLVPPGDAERFGEAIVRLMSDPAERARLGSNGRERVERQFNAGTMLSAYADLYRGLIAARRGAAGPARA